MNKQQNKKEGQLEKKRKTRTVRAMRINREWEADGVG